MLVSYNNVEKVDKTVDFHRVFRVNVDNLLYIE